MQWKDKGKRTKNLGDMPSWAFLQTVPSFAFALNKRGLLGLWMPNLKEKRMKMNDNLHFYLEPSQPQFSYYFTPKKRGGRFDGF